MLKKEGKWKANKKTKGGEGLSCDEGTELIFVFPNFYELNHSFFE